MAATANISSSFVITVRPSNSDATTITNPGRTFRIVAVAFNNTSNGAVDVDVTTSGAITPAGAWGTANAYSFAELTLAGGHLDVAADQNITVQVASHTSADQVDLYCVATGGGQQLTVS